MTIIFARRLQASCIEFINIGVGCKETTGNILIYHLRRSKKTSRKINKTPTHSFSRQPDSGVLGKQYDEERKQSNRDL